MASHVDPIASSSRMREASSALFARIAGLSSRSVMAAVAASTVYCSSEGEDPRPAARFYTHYQVDPNRRARERGLARCILNPSKRWNTHRLDHGFEGGRNRRLSSAASTHERPAFVPFARHKESFARRASRVTRSAQYLLHAPGALADLALNDAGGGGASHVDGLIDRPIF